ncbi:autophagy-related protein 13a isoform X2 [Impatiens glandulifera]|uniref:autophagy-related protein 13a isoform X2 n=1 Tax=Impatiens glandulifera TaxID=253017 RepID=UPI001FB0F119|nr:autophagy-related protein 13a isoform X2 [Impatiens glandulifera]
MDLQGNHSAEHGRFEQIVSQFLMKSLHMILDSRIPSIHKHGHSSEFSAVPSKKSNRWFNLVLGDRPPALDNLSFWHRNLFEPMIIDIILVQETEDSSSSYALSAAFGSGKSVETLLERWVVQYEYSKSMVPQLGESSLSYKKMYKKMIILLRSLYSMMRMLPAYRPFRKLCSSNQSCDFDINYKVFSFGAPFSKDQEKVMKHYSFCPADSAQGRLCVSIAYRESLSDLNLETSTSFPPQIIADYVGSPAADPFRAFPSSNKGVSATSFPLQGNISSRSPSSMQFQRPHSWTSGLHKAQPLVRALSGSPPVYSTSTTPYGSSSPSGLQPNHKTISFEDYQLSPPFSPSPSSSSPNYLPSDNSMQTRHLSETAPVCIPHPMMVRSPKYQFPNLSDPSRHPLPPLSPRSTKLDNSSHESASGIRMLRKSESVKIGEFYSGTINQSFGHKVLKDSKDDSGRFSGVLSSSDSPRFGFSRSSSRLSLQDDLDDDFSCPFIVDDVDSPVSHEEKKVGTEFSSQTSSTNRKSQDAAVGALVHMLRTAPPLRQDPSYYSTFSSSRTEAERETSGSASNFFLPRKTSDALEELKGYREMKQMLLSKSGN